MPKYHINLESGEPGPCSADKGNCPFGGDELHFTSEDAARQAYELIAAAEKAKTLQAWKKKPRTAAKSNNSYSENTYLSGHGTVGHGAVTPTYSSGGHGGHGY